MPTAAKSTPRACLTVAGLKSPAIMMPRRWDGHPHPDSFVMRYDACVVGEWTQNLLDRIGLPQSPWHRDKTVHAAGVVLLNLLILEQWQLELKRTVRMIVPMNKAKFYRSTQKCGSTVAYDPLHRVLSWATRSGLLRVEPGENQIPELGLATAYKLRPGRSVLAEIATTGRNANVRVETAERTGLIRMRDEDKEPMALPDHDNLDFWQHQLDEINRAQRAHRIEFVDRGRVVQLSSNDVTYDRIFSRGRYDAGGRFFAPFQNLRKHIRRTIRIDGQRTVEIDFVAIHVTIAYAKAGLKCEGDPYHLELRWVTGGRQRHVSKNAVLIALNARNIHEAAAALRKKLAEDKVRGRRLEWCYYFVGRAKRVHAPISEFLAKDAGIWFQNDDSHVAAAVMQAFADKGKACLGIHDSFIVKEEDCELLRETMQAEFRRQLGVDCDVKCELGLADGEEQEEPPPRQIRRTKRKPRRRKVKRSTRRNDGNPQAGNRHARAPAKKAGAHAKSRVVVVGRRNRGTGTRRATQEASLSTCGPVQPLETTRDSVVLPDPSRKIGASEERQRPAKRSHGARRTSPTPRV